NADSYRMKAEYWGHPQTEANGTFLGGRWTQIACRDNNTSLTNGAQSVTSWASGRGRWLDAGDTNRFASWLWRQPAAPTFRGLQLTGHRVDAVSLFLELPLGDKLIPHPRRM